MYGCAYCRTFLSIILYIIGNEPKLQDTTLFLVVDIFFPLIQVRIFSSVTISLLKRIPIRLEMG